MDQHMNNRSRRIWTAKLSTQKVRQHHQQMHLYENHTARSAEHRRGCPSAPPLQKQHENNMISKVGCIWMLAESIMTLKPRAPKAYAQKCNKNIINIKNRNSRDKPQDWQQKEHLHQHKMYLCEYSILWALQSPPRISYTWRTSSTPAIKSINSKCTAGLQQEHDQHLSAHQELKLQWWLNTNTDCNSTSASSVHLCEDSMAKDVDISSITHEEPTPKTKRIKRKCTAGVHW